MHCIMIIMIIMIIIIHSLLNSRRIGHHETIESAGT